MVLPQDTHVRLLTRYIYGAAIEYGPVNVIMCAHLDVDQTV